MGDIKLGLIESFLLGATSAAIVKTGVAPIERTKLIFQTSNEVHRIKPWMEPHKGLLDCISRTYKIEGIRSFWRSNSVACFTYIPQQVLSIGFYGIIKNLFKPEQSDGQLLRFTKNIASGSACGVATLLFTYPLEFTRVKLATDIKLSSKAPYQHASAFSVFKKNKRLRRCYHGFFISCAGIMVYRGCYFGLYDSLKPIILSSDAGDVSRFCLGYSVTVASGLIAYPFDTIRCRRIVNMDHPVKSYKYTGSIDCAVKIVKNEGFMSLMKGASVGILRGVAGAGILVGVDKLEEIYSNMREKQLRQE